MRQPALAPRYRDGGQGHGTIGEHELEVSRARLEGARLVTDVLPLELSGELPVALARLAAALPVVDEEQHHAALARLHPAVAALGREQLARLAVLAEGECAKSPALRQLVDHARGAGALLRSLRDEALVLQVLHLLERGAACTASSIAGHEVRLERLESLHRA